MSPWSESGQVVSDLADKIMDSRPAKKIVEMAIPAAAGLAASAVTGNPVAGKLASGAVKTWSVVHGDSLRQVSGVVVASVALPVAALVLTPVVACMMVYAIFKD